MNQPSVEAIRSDDLVRDLELAIGSVDDSRGIGIVSPWTENPRASSGHERDCLQRTDGREEEDERRQR